MFKRNLTPGRELGQVESRYQPKAHQVFRRAREWQFDVFHHGEHTKWRVIQARLKVLCRVLVSFDPSGTGTSIFPAVKSIVTKANELEAQRAVENGTKAHSWDRRKVYRYLRILEDSAVMTCSGSAHNRQPRHRVLHPDKLLKLPANRPKTVNRRRESVTREPLNLSPVEQPNLSPKNTWGEFHTSAPPGRLDSAFESSACVYAESSSEVSPATAKPIDDRTRSLSESNSDSNTQPADQEKAREYYGRKAAMKEFMDETGCDYHVAYMAADLVESRRNQTRLPNPKEWYLNTMRNLSEEDMNEINEEYELNEEINAQMDADHELNHWRQFDGDGDEAVQADGRAEAMSCFQKDLSRKSGKPAECFAEATRIAVELIDGRRRPGHLSNPKAFYLTALRNLSEEDIQDVDYLLDCENSRTSIAHSKETNSTQAMPEYSTTDILHRENVKLAIAESLRTGHTADWILHAIKISDTAEFLGDDEVFEAQQPKLAVEVLPPVQAWDENTIFEELFGRFFGSSGSTMISKEKHPEPEPQKYCYCYACGDTSGTCGCVKAPR